MPYVEYKVPEIGEWVLLEAKMGDILKPFRGLYLGTYVLPWDMSKPRVPWYFVPELQKLVRGSSYPWVLHEEQHMRIPLNGHSLTHDMQLYTDLSEWNNNIRRTDKILPEGYRFQLFDCSIKYADGRNRVVAKAMHHGVEYFIRLDSIQFPVYTE